MSVSKSVKEPKGRKDSCPPPPPAGLEEGNEGQEPTFQFLFLPVSRGTYLCRQSHGLSAVLKYKGTGVLEGSGRNDKR